jgi:hypothetical protein
MDPSDDYLDEMGRLRPHEIEAILSGRETEDPAAEPLAGFIRDIRHDLLEDPEADVAARHLAEMNEAGREERSKAVSTSNDRRDSMRSISQRRLAVLATGAVLVLGVGVAAAVTLPDQASDTAKDAVSNDHAEHGQAVSDTARNTSLQGCEKGQAVAAQASGKTIPAHDPCGHSTGNGGDNGTNGDNGGSGTNDTNGPSGTPKGSGGGSGGPGGGGGGGGSQTGSGGGSGGPGGGGGGGGSTEHGSGGGSGGPGGGGSGGTSEHGGGGSGGPGGGSGGPAGSIPTP